MTSKKKIMMAPQKNCWEYKRCGREPGGNKVKEQGICPATIAKGLDGVNRGKNAGRACWVVADTFCEGEIQGMFVNKYASCTKCDFYQLVEKEEGHGCLVPDALLAVLQGQSDLSNQSRID